MTPLLFQSESKNPATPSAGFIVAERPRVYGPGVIVLLTLFGLSFVVWTLLFSFRVKVEADTELTRREIDTLERTRDKDLEARILAFEKKVRTLSAVLRNHVYYSQLFPVVEGITLPTVFYNSASISAGTETTATGGGKVDVVHIELSGVAPTLLDLARQMIAYREDPRLLRGEVTGFSYKNTEVGGGVTFSAMLAVDKKVVLAN